MIFNPTPIANAIHSKRRAEADVLASAAAAMAAVAGELKAKGDAAWRRKAAEAAELEIQAQLRRVTDGQLRGLQGRAAPYDMTPDERERLALIVARVARFIVRVLSLGILDLPPTPLEMKVLEERLMACYVQDEVRARGDGIDALPPAGVSDQHRPLPKPDPEPGPGAPAAVVVNVDGAEPAQRPAPERPAAPIAPAPAGTQIVAVPPRVLTEAEAHAEIAVLRASHPREDGTALDWTERFLAGDSELATDWLPVIQIAPQVAKVVAAADQEAKRKYAGIKVEHDSPWPSEHERALYEAAFAAAAAAGMRFADDERRARLAAEYRRLFLNDDEQTRRWRDGGGSAEGHPGNLK